jgi:hypothetical protein
MALLAGLFVALTREPVYQGKTLSAWLLIYRTEAPLPDMGLTQRAQESADAVRQLGPKAVPWLVEWISYEQPAWQRSARFMLRTIVRRLGGGASPSHLARPAELRQAAVAGFRILGPEAAAAVPALSRLLKAHSSRAVSLLVMDALSHLGKAGLPPLLDVLANPARPDRLLAMESLGEMSYLGNDAHPAVLAMIQCLDDKDARIADSAAMALGTMALEAEIVVPALAGKLESRDESLRSSCATALGMFGEQARTASPALVKALSDSSEDVRAEAASALAEIDPEALEKAAPK